MKYDEQTIDIKDLIKNGYRIFVPDNNSSYLYMLTPNNNIMCAEYNNMNGWFLTIKYRPNKKTGSGCFDSDALDHFSRISAKEVHEAEQANYIFALSLKAEFFKSFDEFKKQYWRQLTEVFL